MSVYTTLNNNDLSGFLRCYEVGELTAFQGISEGIENTNYFVSTRQGGMTHDFVLTIFESLQPDELSYYLALMAFLADHGLVCARPVADRQAHHLQVLKNKPAALVQRLPGRSVLQPKDEHCRQIGAFLAQLHTLGQRFEQRKLNSRGHAWRRDTAAKITGKLAEDEQLLLQQELAFQEQHWAAVDKLPSGVIHADLFRDNALFDGDRLTGVIDFYYACDDLLLYDIAVTVNDWCSRDDGALDIAKVAALLRGYHSVRALSSMEQSYWPLMLRAAALRFWLSRLQDQHYPRAGELTHLKDPDVFKRILSDRVQSAERITTLWVG